MAKLWTADSIDITADSISATADGAVLMPNLIGYPYRIAEKLLVEWGLLDTSQQPFPFGAFPISAFWKKSTSPPSTILAQSITAGTQIAVNTPILLTMSEYPFGIVFP